jgi:SAM-dependent methyltransferase
MSTDEQATYLFDNAWTEARRRLALLEEALDGLTFHRLERIGVGAGWHCLDVGVGGGSVAHWLARRVGSTGRVLATDLDTRFLEGPNEPQLEVRRHDISADPLPSGSYDLVHTRLVLMHLPARAEVLARLVTALKPGGWLLVEEWDVFPLVGLATGAYARVWEAFLEASRQAGSLGDWARDLPALLARAHLIQLAAEATVALFQGGAVQARFWDLTWEQVRERIQTAGATPEEFEQVQALLRDERQWFVGPALIAVWGQRAT